MTIVIERLKTLLAERGTSVSEFARFIGLKQPTLNNYLKGDRTPTIDSIVMICNKCCISSDWLLGISNDRSAETKTIIGMKSRVADLKVSAQTVSNNADALLKSITEMEGKL